MRSVAKMDCRFLPLLLLLLPVLVLSQSPSPADWKTLSGRPPLVIANGGSSGLFPGQTVLAYQYALLASVDGIVLTCDLQLTKDFKGICRTGLDLTTSTVLNYDSNRLDFKTSTYEVNGQNVTGVFSIDLTYQQINETAFVRQGTLSRSPAFDGLFPVSTPSDVIGILSQYSELSNKTAYSWLNVEYAKFYEAHGLNMTDFVESALKIGIIPDYLSSTEVALLRSLGTIVGRSRSPTKLIFKIPSLNAVEPTTGRRYSSFTPQEIKNFSSGVLVEGSAIRPIDPATNYSSAPTSLVQDYHKVNLTVFSGPFVNDVVTVKSYNYSYDPIREYLSFISDGEFSVDGVLTDFPTTASEAISCYASSESSSILQTGPTPLNPLAIRRTIISHNGASGDYPGCTILSYRAAVRDGADYIDCPVQLTKDGVAICRESPDLIPNTDVSTNQDLLQRTTTIGAIQKGLGLFTFNLTWSEISQLKAVQSKGFNKCTQCYYRDSAYDDQEGILRLSDFLEIAKNFSGTGIFIDLQNAYFLATEAGLNAVDTVVAVLKQAGFDGRPNASHPVLLQSEDSSALERLQEVLPDYPRIYRIKVETNQPVLAENVTTQALEEIKKFASAVTIPKAQILLPLDPVLYFLPGNTSVVRDAHEQNLTVFVAVQRNEPDNFAFDFESDPTRELNTLTEYYNVDGFISDFPATVAAYLRQRCYGPVEGLKLPPDNFTIPLVEPGALYRYYLDFGLPASPPSPPVPPSQVGEPPLPFLLPPQAPAGPLAPSGPPTPGLAPPPSPSSVDRLQVPVLLLICLLSVVLIF